MPHRQPITTAAIVRSTPATAPSVPNAAASCGASPSCRASSAISRFVVTRHDIDSTVCHRQHRPQHSRACRRNASGHADRSPSARLYGMLAQQIDVALTRRPRLSSLPPPKRTFHTHLATTVVKKLPACRHHYLHSAKTPAPSFNPASMRSRSSPTSWHPRAPRPHRTLMILESPAK